jgi:HEPN domain-containing protein
MPAEVGELFAEQSSIIDELFIKTADDNYITARWCFHRNLNVDFLWLAVHCVEKYLKAVLLFNDGTSVQHGHDINLLYADVRKFADDLLPPEPTMQQGMSPGMWRKETYEQFIGRLYRDGQADNRYQLYGYSRMPEDLWKLDQLVYSVRRLCRPLDANIMTKNIPGGPTSSNRDMLKANLKRWTLNSRLEDALAGKIDEEVKRAVSFWNFPFTPEDFPRPAASYTFASKDSVFIRRLFDPLNAEPPDIAHADKLWAWVKTHIKLPKELKDQIEAERKKLKSKRP